MPIWPAPGDTRIITGVVQRGRQLGRQLGFPTANVNLGSSGAPFGVYATRTWLEDGREFSGVASIGTNPTFGHVAPVLEVWMFDFDEDIYGQTIRTELVAFLRGERKFATVNALVEQVAIDAAETRQLLTIAAKIA
jgi:riboflavin kinase/FMN adenylyltransferase